MTHTSSKALQRFHAGDFVGAEELHLKALRIKEKAFDGASIEVALTRNALGEAQLRQGKLDEAQRNLEIAVRIRNSASSKNRDHVPDAAVSRENLAHEVREVHVLGPVRVDPVIVSKLFDISLVIALLLLHLGV